MSPTSSLDVRDIRLRLGLSQRELGLRLGVTGRTIWRWEHARERGGTLPHAIYLAKLQALADTVPIKEAHGKDPVTQEV